MADLVTVPLPDGATLVTFLDVTDTINVERALRERNEALETADVLKVDFVHHVSYELRSPLTNIIGFAQLMGEPSLGALNPKQREYLGYINASTNALLAIINDILDLATIDAGAMKLNLGPVDIRRTMNAAAEGIRDRLVKDGLTLDIVAAPDIGSFTGRRAPHPADPVQSARQCGRLLAGRARPSRLPPSAGPMRSCSRSTDNGPGIPPEVQDRVFDWFETHSQGSRHRGAGLGLSIVRSFVELHGGTVTLSSDGWTGHHGGLHASRWSSTSSARRPNLIPSLPRKTNRLRRHSADRRVSADRSSAAREGMSERYGRCFRSPPADRASRVALASEQATSGW